MLTAIKLGCGFAIGTSLVPFAFIGFILLILGGIFLYFKICDIITRIRRRKWRNRH